VEKVLLKKSTFFNPLISKIMLTMIGDFWVGGNILVSYLVGIQISAMISCPPF
jgi:hypothetical protein